jgi:polyhydroxyalkanoate synthase
MDRVRRGLFVGKAFLKQAPIRTLSMADQDTQKLSTPTLPSLQDLQHWTWVMGRAQQMMMEHVARQVGEAARAAPPSPAQIAAQWPGMNMLPDPGKIAQAQVDMWTQGLSIWQRALGGQSQKTELVERADKDKRFNAPEWQQNPLFDMIRQSYLLISDRLLGSVEALEGVDGAARERLRFTTRAFVDAMAPSNFAVTNPQVLARTLETRGDNLLKGLENMLRDLSKGQLSHTDPEAFEVGRNIAVTPGKVIYQTPMFQLIQYSPTTDEVYETPLIVFPPWINRFYILDLNPKKSFIRWAVEQGLTVFVVSWKSADETLKDVTMDDYVLAQVEAIDVVRDLLKVDDVHTIGYCVAGTKLAATLALLEARDEADKVASATFFTPRSISRGRRPSPCSSATSRCGSSSNCPPTRASWTAATWPPPSTCCAAAISSGTTSSTITCSARITRRSTCSTGTGIRPTPGQMAPDVSEAILPGE